MKKKLKAAARLLLVTFGWLAFSAVVQATGVPDLTELPLEDLMKIEITTASKRPESLVDIPNAAYVLTADDIRRSGALSIPEALRLVPGIDVARISNNSWAIASRGFNSRFANKLLVLIDGRAVYTPLYSGVFWDRQDLVMDDIERIEVIRGPGAALWGANAVNGVINVITKNAEKTQGNYTSAAYGTEDDRIVEYRYGGKIKEETAYRVYAKYYDKTAGDSVSGVKSNDVSEVGRFGFRSDWAGNDGDELALFGSYASGNVGDDYSVGTLTTPFSTSVRDDSETNNGYLLGRWTRRLGNGSDFQVQVYNDYSAFSDTRVAEARNTTDIEVHHTTAWGERHTLVWGGGVRRSADSIENSPTVTLQPSSETTYLFNTFIDDTISFDDDRYSLSVGTKLEHNDYTGFEFQPSLRGRWHVNNSNTVWAGVSRAVRTPSRAERDITVNSTVVPPLSPGNTTAFPLALPIIGSKDLVAEKLIAYEAGYRTAPADNLTFDVATFYNVYDDLVSVSQGTTTFLTSPVNHLRTPINVTNGAKGETYGFEVATDYRPVPQWRLRASYAFLKVDMRASDPTTLSSFAAEGQSPQQKAQLWAQTDLAKDVTLDMVFRYVDRLPALGISDYFTADARIGWQINKNVSVSLVGRNLFEHGMAEFGNETVLPSAVTATERQAIAILEVRF